MCKNFKLYILLLLGIITNIVFADVKLPVIFSDHMVLQRGTNIRIWGWADNNESIKVYFNNQVKETRADQNGNWIILLDEMTAGGPYDLKVTGKNTIIVKDIWIGDVWICSGQSNMQMKVKQSKNAEEEIKNANYSNIRLFNVNTLMSGQPKSDLTNEHWDICSPNTIADFSAVGYFFGRELNQNLDVPIGLIETAWGGTLIESWMSKEAVNKFPEFSELTEDLKNRDIDELVANRDQFKKEWSDNLDLVDTGILEKWYNLKVLDSSWSNMRLPQRWEDGGLEGFDGSVWFKTEFELNKSQLSDSLILNFGQIDDTDFIYLNGKLVGNTEKTRKVYRRYKIMPELLNEGRNILICRVIDHSWSGGFVAKEEDFFYKISGEQYTFAGNWKYKIGNEIPGYKNIGPNTYPTLLYNSMVNPLVNFKIKGVIWYQGEANTRRAYHYRKLFPAVITDWRNKWQQGDFPFLFVQLANYKSPVLKPSESQWAELRESQLAALELKNTGMAVIIDIGEADDIHPKNKQEVGHRLALAAQKITYRKNLVYSGPIYKSYKIEDDKIKISFDHTGSGLIAKDKYGYLKGFTIAGKDSQFVWAKAYIKDDKVVVFNNKVKKPIAVRYGWSDNPDDINLYNKEGLPASPFRTDSWPGITQ